MTCQLCGKPLPKMRLRRDVDFCCREHREQYRLRRGLNLLQEAGELAALRRRRERPTAMALQRPAGSSWEAPRRAEAGSYPGSAHEPADRSLRPLEIVSEMGLQAAERIPALPRGYVGVASCARRGSAGSRNIEPPLMLAPRNAPARSAVLETRVPGAMGFQATGARRASAAAERRASDWKPALPNLSAAPGRETPFFTRPRVAWSSVLHEPARPLPGPVGTRRGGAEAVFSARGELALPAHRPTAFAVHPAMARFTAASSLGAASRHGERRGPADLGRRDLDACIRFGEMAARLARPRALRRFGEGAMKPLSACRKRAAARHGFAAMRFPAAAPLAGVRGARSIPGATSIRSAAQLLPVVARGGTAPGGERRSSPGGWTLPAIVEPRALGPRTRRQPPAAPVAPMHAAPRTGLDAMRPRAAAARGAFEIAPPAIPARHAAPLAGRGELGLSAHRRAAAAGARGEAARQTAHVPAPQHEPLLNQNRLTLQGTFMGTMEDAGTSVRLEENFAAGLNRWVGQVDTWRLDAAGVRTGGLALFGPSLGMRDCELEFLAKVESGGAGWVFRAADLNNYYHVRLRLAGTAAKPVWELVRGAVVGGAAESPVITPLEIALRAKTSFHVQMTAAGGEFTAAVEGQEVARWGDARLRTGGIGFFAEKDDRTRLYWVKVASPSFGVANDE